MICKEIQQASYSFKLKSVASLLLYISCHDFRHIILMHNIHTIINRHQGDILRLVIVCHRSSSAITTLPNLVCTMCRKRFCNYMTNPLFEWKCSHQLHKMLHVVGKQHLYSITLAFFFVKQTALRNYQRWDELQGHNCPNLKFPER